MLKTFIRNHIPRALLWLLDWGCGAGRTDRYSCVEYFSLIGAALRVLGQIAQCFLIKCELAWFDSHGVPFLLPE